ncbi:MAG TPA: hypothetical protein VEG66_05520 [Thermoplasmata archaeon]|jgi:hypothetical protein|nr:hypothetical protein [Thermoplasmata archaeon]
MSNASAIAASLVFLSVIALVLAALVLRRYRNERRACYLYWGLGLFLFFVTLVEEAVLDFGVWSQPLIQSYLVLVAVLVGILSMGSAEISLARRWRWPYYGYLGVTSVALVVVGFTTTIPTSIISNGVVSGLPPTSIDLISSLITFPAAVLLIVSALYGTVKYRRYHLLYIALGTGVISAAGTLYLVSFPATLYYAEFLGILLLFLGFVRIPRIAAETRPQPNAV